MTSRRIVILGCSGSGKSTLARAIGENIGVPVVHLDALYWKPGWVESETEEFVRRVEAAHAGEAWVSDGNFASKTWPIRIPRADLILKLECPRWLCLWRVAGRWLTHLGRTRADVGADCPEKIDLPFLEWIWNYEKRWPRYERELRGYGVEGRFKTLHSREVADFVRELS